MKYYVNELGQVYMANQDYGQRVARREEVEKSGLCSVKNALGKEIAKCPEEYWTDEEKRIAKK